MKIRRKVINGYGVIFSPPSLGWHTYIRLLLISAFTSLLLACGGGGAPPESRAWVRIDAPENASSTSSDTVVAKGNAAMRDGSYPQQIYWKSNGSSGVTRQSVLCLLVCIAAWEATIPLDLGNNVITVTMLDGSDTVTITRLNAVSVSGRISLNDTSGASVPDIPVTIKGTNTNYSVRTDEAGTYSFSHVSAGAYTITPSQPAPPQSSNCLSISPWTRELTVPVSDNSDIYLQNFIATQVEPCFSIGGRVTPSTNPTYGMPDIKITLSDQVGNEMVRYTNSSGYYSFSQLKPGIYTVTPSSCSILECFSFTPALREINIVNGDVHAQDFLRMF